MPLSHPLEGGMDLGRASGTVLLAAWGVPLNPPGRWTSPNVHLELTRARQGSSEHNLPYGGALGSYHILSVSVDKPAASLIPLRVRGGGYAWVE